MANYYPMGYLERRSCQVCGKKFKPTSRSDRYCSRGCMQRRFDAPRLDFTEDNARIVPPGELAIMSFRERQGMAARCQNKRCDRVFTIGENETGKLDKRSRFCCAACEKQYWRDVTRHPKRELDHERDSTA